MTGSRQACSGLRKEYKSIRKEDLHMYIAVTYETEMYISILDTPNNSRSTLLQMAK